MDKEGTRSRCPDVVRTRRRSKIEITVVVGILLSCVVQIAVLLYLSQGQTGPLRERAIDFGFLQRPCLESPKRKLEVIVQNRNCSECKHNHLFQRIKLGTVSAIVKGRQRATKGFMTIGIPHVKREGANYLINTINSILKELLNEDMQEVVLVILLADQNQTYKRKMTSELIELYSEHLKSGLLQVIEAPVEIYTGLSELKNLDLNITGGAVTDGEKRIKWRVKQTIDYAFLLYYCRNISEYYLQLEDDIIVSSRFVKRIRLYLSLHTKYWFSLEFSKIGFIGKFLRSAHLEMISEFLITFRLQQPPDLLFGTLRAHIMGQGNATGPRASFFQHKGVISSLDGKRQPIIDKSFGYILAATQRRFYTHVNPEASIRTSLISRNREYHTPESPYIFGNDLLWCNSPAKGDYYDIILDKPINLTRIYIKTGHIYKRSSYLHDGIVKIKSNCGHSEKLKSCKGGKSYGRFIFEGKFDTKWSYTLFPANICCLRIEVTESQKDDLVLEEIALFQESDMRKSKKKFEQV